MCRLGFSWSYLLFVQQREKIEQPEKYYMLNVQCEVAPLCGEFELEEDFDLAQLTIKCGIDPIMEISLLRNPSTLTYKTKTGEERKNFLQNLETLENELGLEVDTSNNVLVKSWR